MTKIVAAIATALLSLTLALAGIAMSAPASAHPTCGVGTGHVHYNWQGKGKDYKTSPGNAYWENGVYKCKINEWWRWHSRGDSWKWNGQFTHVVTRKI